MAHTNMDPKNYPNATSPVMEFVLNKSEVDAPLKVGEIGKIVIPVEVIAESESTWCFRKRAGVEAEGNFRKETAADMKERLLADQEDESEDADEE